VRHAIAAALDVDEIIRTVLDGKGIRVATMLTDKHFGFDPALKPIKQDVARARKLLAEAGYPNGIDLTLNSTNGRYVRDKEVAEAVTGQLSKAGIRTTLKTFEFVNYLNAMVYTHKAGPVWLIGWGVASVDAENVYVPLFRSGKVMANYANSEFDRMIDEAQTIMDEKKRLEQYHRINRLWLDDLPAVPLYQQIDLYGVNKRLVWKSRRDEVIKAWEIGLKDAR
jgi:peptide/nickel transport system substrate-binding protein